MGILTRNKKKVKESCIYAPVIDGAYSRLFQGLQRKAGQDRPLGNYLYSLYKTTGTPEAMDAAGYKRNSQDEHSAADVIAFLDGISIINEYNISNDNAAQSYGVMDSHFKLIDFDAQDAFDRATEINNKSKGKVAFVRQHGDKFNVIVDGKDSRTQIHAAETAAKMVQWQGLQEEFTAAGIDLDDLASRHPSQINPLRTTNFLRDLYGIKSIRNKNLTESDIDIILSLADIAKAPTVASLYTRGWGNRDEIIAKIKDILGNPSSYASTTVDLVDKAITEAKNHMKIAPLGLKQQLEESVDRSSQFFNDSIEYQVQDILNTLKKDFNIDVDTKVIDPNKQLERLSDAAARSMMILKSQIDTLERRKGDSAKLKAIKQTLDNIRKELEQKKYYTGMLYFLKDASGYANKIINALASCDLSGMEMQKIAAVSKIYHQARDMRDAYYPLVKALSDGSLLIDAEVSNADLQNLRNQAANVAKQIESFDRHLNKLRQGLITSTVEEVFGADKLDGMTVAEFLDHGTQTSLMDSLFYGGERQSNPIIGMVGTIIRDAQIKRDERVAEISSRIREINNNLESNHEDSRFMFEEVHFGKDGERMEYYIASPYDWGKFDEERRKHYAGLVRMGLDSFAIKDEMDAWYEHNTEWVVVDQASGRQEKVPKLSLYAKSSNFQEGWTDSQKEYYNEMMKLKGELGTLLPAWAQHQYRPPQVRQDFAEILRKGATGELSFKQTSAALREHINKIKPKENDEVSIAINGEVIKEGRGDVTGRISREIPVMYVNKLKNQNDLLKDFSAGVQHLASTAINYNAMTEIQSTVEFIADYIRGLKPIARNADGDTIAQTVKSNLIVAAQKLQDFAGKKGASDIIDGFVEMHLYGITLTDTDAFSRTLQQLINYTSLNQLAPNLKGAISNYLMGEAQMMIDALAGSLARRAKVKNYMYSTRDYIAAHALMFGDRASKGWVADHLSNNINSKAHLLEEMFDPLNELAAELGGQRYYKSAFMKTFGGFNAMGMYSAGESLIHLVNMYAVLNNEKVLLNGKKVSLYSVLEKETNQDTNNSKLVIKKDRLGNEATQLDGNVIDEEYLRRVKERIRAINQETHGAMNKEDKGLIHRRMMGRAVMNFRQWMVEHYSRRFRGRHWDGARKEWIEGYWTTMGKFLKSYAADIFKFQTDAAAHWNELDDNQKMNIFRAVAEASILAALQCLSMAAGDPSDHKDEYWYRMFIYQVNRMLMEEKASTPNPAIIKEGLNILNSPVASVKTMENMLYPFTGIGDIDDTIKSGRYKGRNKYFTNVMRKNLPFFHQIDQNLHIGDEDYVFNIFN